MKIIRTEGPLNFFFFVCSIFLGSCYIINLIFAIVATSYFEQRKLALAELEERRQVSD